MSDEFEKILSEGLKQMLGTPLFNAKFISLGEYMQEVYIPIKEFVEKYDSSSDKNNSKYWGFMFVETQTQNNITMLKDSKSFDGWFTQLDLRIMQNFQTSALNRSADDDTIAFVRGQVEGFNMDDYNDAINEINTLMSKLMIETLLKREEAIRPYL